MRKSIDVASLRESSCRCGYGSFLGNEVWGLRHEGGEGSRGDAAVFPYHLEEGGKGMKN